MATGNSVDRVMNSDITTVDGRPVLETLNTSTQFWDRYTDEADNYDKQFLTRNRDDMESVLLFAGLFSAVSATFLVAMQTGLSPNPAETTNALLMQLVQSLDNTTFPNQPPVIPTWNGPTTAILWSQATGYAGLSASLLAALGAVLGKQWLNEFNHLGGGTPEQRGRQRQQKLDSLRTWRFELVLGSLSALIQLALLLFGITMAINLWQMNPVVGSVLIAAVALGVFFYLSMTIASLFYPTCPFHTPISSSIQGFTVTAMKSLEEVANYWAWLCREIALKRPMISPFNRIMAYLLPLLLGAAFLIMISTFTALSMALFPVLLLVLWSIFGLHFWKLKDVHLFTAFHTARLLGTLRRVCHRSACGVRDSAQYVLDFIHRGYHDPQPDPQGIDARAIAWLLETSNHPEFLKAAAARVTEIGEKWPAVVQLPAHHLSILILRWVSEIDDPNNALMLGKAVMLILCNTVSINSHACDAALNGLRHLDGKSVDHDLSFILSVVKKLLLLRRERDALHLQAGHSVPASLPEGRLSDSFLEWFLIPLQTLLLLQNSYSFPFLPEAGRVLQELQWSQVSKLSPLQQARYFRTFDIYFDKINSDFQINDLPKYEPAEIYALKGLPAVLSRILEKLENSGRYSPLSLRTGSPTHRRFFPYLSHLPETNIMIWALESFEQVVLGAGDSNDDNSWLFATCLFQLASNNLLLPTKPTVDSEVLLSFLTTNVKYITLGQLEFAFNVIHVNQPQFEFLATHPKFVNYLQGLMDSADMFSVAKETIFAVCDFLLSPEGQSNPQRLAIIRAGCKDLGRFIHHAILHQDPPIILTHLFYIKDEAFKASVLAILTPYLRDPDLDDILHATANFTAIGANDSIPDIYHLIADDLSDLEIMFVLLNDEDQRAFCDQIDSSLHSFQHNFRHWMALPLSLVISWLLRSGGPVNSSETLRRRFLQPDYKNLLVAAWKDPRTVKADAQMRYLINYSKMWLSTPSVSLDLSDIVNIERELEDVLSELGLQLVRFRNAVPNGNKQASSRHHQDEVQMTQIAGVVSIKNHDTV